MKDIRTYINKLYINESKKKLKNISNDELKNDILAISPNDKKLNDAVDLWLDKYNKLDLKLYFDYEAEVYFKTEKYNYEFNKIDKKEVENILEILKKDGIIYPNDYSKIIMNDSIIYSKTSDGVVILRYEKH